MRRTSLERSVRFAGYGVLGLVVAAVLFNVYRARASGPGETVASEREAAASPRDLVDRTAVTVALAVGAFELRARLFDSRRMACPDLARRLPAHRARLGGPPRPRGGRRRDEQHRRRRGRSAVPRRG